MSVHGGMIFVGYVCLIAIISGCILFRSYSVISVVGFLGCAVALMYPVISDSWNSWRDHLLLDSYNAVAQQKNATDIDDILMRASEYNRVLSTSNSNTVKYGSGDKDVEYEEQLNIDRGIMGYIEIPKIAIVEPIYHYSDADTLEVGIGHLKGSSLPCGGTDTHCLLTGHRGLPNRKFFTDIDRLTVGDVFYIHILTKVLAYRVYGVATVLPSEVDSLSIQRGKDLVTLITCTPYGVNSHRLLVKAERIPFDDTVVEVGSLTVAEQEYVVDNSVYILGGFLLFLLLLGVYRVAVKLHKKYKGHKRMGGADVESG